MNRYVTERELECWRLMALGHSTKEIGSLMSISAKTVETMRDKMRRRTGARGVADFTRLAYEFGVIPLPTVTALVEESPNHGHVRFYLPIRKEGV